MKIATWNVNSVRARLDCIKDWINKENPDVLLLQEIKCRNEDFPYEFFEDLGFNNKVLGQKSYNGVAILSKYSIEDSIFGLPTFSDDMNARYIECVVGGNKRVASIYVPNGGQEVGGESYLYKLKFLDKLNEHLENILQFDEAIFIGGDYNIAPDDRDVYNPKLWKDRVCCTKDERDRFFGFKSLGYFDVLDMFFEKDNDTNRPFTWWDYKNKKSFESNMGLRLDHFLSNENGMNMVSNIFVDSTVRTSIKPSDHAPVVIVTK